jgi:hypothetical protein
MAAPVVGDGAQAVRGQPVELPAPDRRAQRPAMDEDHRTAGADILVEELLAVRRFDEAVGGGEGKGLIVHRHLHRRCAREMRAPSGPVEYRPGNDLARAGSVCRCGRPSPCAVLIDRGRTPILRGHPQAAGADRNQGTER